MLIPQQYYNAGSSKLQAKSRRNHTINERSIVVASLALVTLFISLISSLGTVDAFTTATTSSNTLRPHCFHVAYKHNDIQQQEPSSSIASSLQKFHRTTTTSKRNLYPQRRQQQQTRNHATTRLYAQKSGDEDRIPIIIDDDDGDSTISLGSIVGLVAGQSSLIVLAVLAAYVLKTPNYGLGPGMDASLSSLGQGVLWTLPLGVVAYLLDRVEENVPALQDVTKATQQITLTVLGPTFRPLLALATSAALGLAAGVGEELLFRGVMQYELGNSRFLVQLPDLAALGITSVVFGALHAVTPLYALLAGVASLYFGWLYLAADNLAIPMACHAFYDLVALMYAHWTVTTQMSPKAQQALQEWRR